MATDGTLWYRLENGEKTTIRNKTNFHERSGVTSFAANRVDGSPLSAFLGIICQSMLKKILYNTNRECIRVGADFRVEINDISAFIAISYCRGIFCKGHRSLCFNDLYGLPIISSLMSRNKFQSIM